MPLSTNWSSVKSRCQCVSESVPFFLASYSCRLALDRVRVTNLGAGEVKGVSCSCKLAMDCAMRGR